MPSLLSISRIPAFVVVAAAGLACTGAVLSDVGKSLKEVADAYHYGPPLKVADLADGRREFQWEMRESMVVRRLASPYAGVDVFAPPGATVAADPNVTPLKPDCIYRVYAKWTAEKSDWLIVDIRKPDITCV